MKTVKSHYAQLFNVIIITSKWVRWHHSLHFIDETTELSDWKLLKLGNVIAEIQILVYLIPLTPLGLPSIILILLILAFCMYCISFMVTV